MPRTLRLASTAALAAAAACASAAPRVVTGPGGAVGVTAGVRLGWATKRLATKEPPATLVAEDGTVCRVTPDRYAATEERALVSCDWQPGAPPGREPPAGASPSDGRSR